jgi:FtsZ-binding cell division protein ZapB
MDIKAFEALETKINRVLDRVRVLQDEKQQLQRKISELESRHFETVRELETARHERDSLVQNQRNPEHEEMIRTKITALLEKLEAA